MTTQPRADGDNDGWQNTGPLNPSPAYIAGYMQGQADYRDQYGAIVHDDNDEEEEEEGDIEWATIEGLRPTTEDR